MKTELFTVSKIFNECIFRIPDYQRGYSWLPVHLKDFWADIEQLADGKSHYTGVLTLEPVPAPVWSEWNDDRWIITSRRYAPYFVVDGQQRLTTISILLHCILSASNGADLNFTPIDIIRRKYIFDTKATDHVRSYMFGYEKDNPSYEYLKTRIFDETSDSYSTGEATIYTKNLKDAKVFFMDKVSNLNQEQLDNLFSKVTQQLVFNVYEISEEIDVSVAFETMNNRGKPLTTLELLKNRLIYLASQMTYTDNEGGLHLRRVINDAWKTVYHNLGKNENRPLPDDEFLRTHLAVYYQTNLTKELPSDPDEAMRAISIANKVVENPSTFLLAVLFARRRLTSTDHDGLPHLDPNLLHEYSSHLKKSVQIYFKLSTPEVDGYSDNEKVLLEQIGRLRGYGASPLVLALFHKEKKAANRVAVLAAHERYHFLLTLRYGSQRLFQTKKLLNVEFAKFIRGKLTPQELITFYDNNVDARYKNENVADVLGEWIKNGLGYYGWRGINYFLFEYEISLRDQSKTGRNKIDWDVFCVEDYDSEYASVEHIYPQVARVHYWTERFKKFNATERRALKNSLGNLVALSKPKNSSLSNKSFPEKLERTQDTVGFRYGSYSENEVASYAEWTAENIVDRGIKMLTFLESRWNFPIGGTEAKIKALGLSFMLTKGYLSLNK
jgi:hypothetical protein